MTLDRDEASFFATSLTRAIFGDKVGLCAIINVKSGGCSNDCRFCAQSSYNKTGAPVVPLPSGSELTEKISLLNNSHISHIGLVAAGSKMDISALAEICEAVATLPLELKNKICFSFGTLEEDAVELIKAAGIRRYHHNLETSRSFYPGICSTQSWDRRARTVRMALDAGLEVCSGFLFGLGESWEDRIDLAFSLKELGVRHIPMNFLIPIPGSPLEYSPRMDIDEIIWSAIIFRLFLRDASLRICAGRIPEQAMGKLFEAGVDAMMTGDLLTTKGSALNRDLEILRKNGLVAEARE